MLSVSLSEGQQIWKKRRTNTLTYIILRILNLKTIIRVHPSLTLDKQKKHNLGLEITVTQL